VWCWGQILGDTCSDDACLVHTAPQRVPGFEHVAEIALGDGQVFPPGLSNRYVGPNLYGRDVSGTLHWVGHQRDLAVDAGAGPGVLAFDAPIRRLDVGSTGGCALLVGGEVRCFGDVDRGEGFPATGLRPIPALQGSEQVVSGLQFTCASKHDGSVACFGDNLSGSLGDRTTVPRATLGPVVGVDDVVQLAASRRAACAVRGGGEVWCWGDIGG
jgi:hypothetical protein